MSQTGAERYLQDRLSESEYREAYEAALDRLEETQARWERAWTIYTHGVAFICGLLFALAFLWLLVLL